MKKMWQMLLRQVCELNEVGRMNFNGAKSNLRSLRNAFKGLLVASWLYLYVVSYTLFYGLKFC
jgi:hypothetical protein